MLCDRNSPGTGIRNTGGSVNIQGGAKVGLQL